MDQRTDRRRAFHRVRQPNVQWELSGFADRAAKNEQRNERGARTKPKQSSGFEATFSAIVE